MSNYMLLSEYNGSGDYKNRKAIDDSTEGPNAKEE